MDTSGGLRERKKLETRRRIAEAAAELFAEHGYANVAISRIAVAADVSEGTVFNYFPTKEDLIFDGMEAYEDTLLEVVRSRAPGTSVVDAFREHVLQPRGALVANDPDMIEQIATIARVIADSRQLRAREHEVIDRATNELAEIIAKERKARPEDIEPWAIANALMGVNRATTRAVHHGAMKGRTGAQIARTALAQARRTFDTLENGLGG